MTKIMETDIEYLRAAIKRSGLSQVKFADSIGMQARNFRRMLKGDKPIMPQSRLLIDLLYPEK